MVDSRAFCKSPFFWVFSGLFSFVCRGCLLAEPEFNGFTFLLTGSYLAKLIIIHSLGNVFQILGSISRILGSVFDILESVSEILRSVPIKSSTELHMSSSKTAAASLLNESLLFTLKKLKGLTIISTNILWKPISKIIISG